jgi:hypothetical protein
MLIKNLNEMRDLRNDGSKMAAETKKGIKRFRLIP